MELKIYEIQWTDGKKDFGIETPDFLAW